MTEQIRANRVTVAINEDGHYVATFYRTHKQVGQVVSTETGFVPMDGVTKSTNRELFRVYVCTNSTEFGIVYDATNRQPENAQFPRAYTSEDMLAEVSTKTVYDDVNTWLEAIRSEFKQEITLSEVRIEGITGLHEYAGRVVEPRYKSGNLAYAKADLVVVLDIKDGDKDTILDADVTCQLVSGQFKKPANIGTAKYGQPGLKSLIAGKVKEFVLVNTEGMAVEQKKSKKESK